MAATELAALVQAGKASCREVVQAHLDRISQVNQLLNAVTVPLAETALTAAEAADRAFSRGEPSGPLSGVPMTVKENIDVAGSATTHGIAPLRDAVASYDAPHIGELRAAGTIPVGRTNMPEFWMRWHTVSALRGATLNPWSAGHTPADPPAVVRPCISGRVPGAAAPGAVRVPAARCARAHARHVRDLRLAFREMCGRSGGDPWYAPVPLDGPPRSTTRSWPATAGPLSGCRPSRASHRVSSPVSGRPSSRPGRPPRESARSTR
jgi:amidase